MRNEEHKLRLGILDLGLLAEDLLVGSVSSASAEARSRAGPSSVEWARIGNNLRNPNGAFAGALMVPCSAARENQEKDAGAVGDIFERITAYASQT